MTWYITSDPDACVHCSATGCQDGSAQHSPECPFTTGMWPVEPADVERGAVCLVCESPFVVGELSAQVAPRSDSRLAEGLRANVQRDMSIYDAEVTFTLCLPCAAMNAEVSE